MGNVRFSMGMQLTLMFTVVVVLFMGILGFTLLEFRQAGREADVIVNRTAVDLATIKSGHTEFTRALLNMRGFLFYPDGMAVYEKNYRDSIVKSLDLIKEYNQTVTAPERKSEGEKIQKALEWYIDYADKRMIPARKSNAPNWLALTGEGRNAVTEIDAGFAKLAEAQQVYLVSQGPKIVTSSERNSQIAAILSGVILVVVILLIFLYSRHLSTRLDRVCRNLEQVGQLNLSGNPIPIIRNDELGDIGRIGNSMRESLKGFVKQIHSNSEQLAAASEELSATVTEQMRSVALIAQSIDQIAVGSVKNADSIHTMSATLEEISAGAETIRHGANEVDQSTKTTAEAASQGMGMLRRVVEQNESISNKMQEIDTVAADLSTGSEKIRGIVSVIDQIAGQTNLLALNAAIEAARAGEAGRGFAVVAEEVRRLAEQSSEATKDIGDIISQMSEKIAYAVTAVKESTKEAEQGQVSAIDTQKGFESILQRLADVQKGIGHIALSVAETAQGTQSMVQNVESISSIAAVAATSADQVAQTAHQQSRGMEEINSSAADLANLAMSMRQIVEKFKL